MPGFQCSHCKEWHEGLPDLALESPDQYVALSEAERQACTKNSDLCVIPGGGFFALGLIEVPIVGHPDERFGISAWVSLSEKNFVRYLDIYNATDVTGDGPWFGWFCNSIAGYPETFGLKARLLLRPHPQRPLIELEPTKHPLAEHQRNGITLAEAQKLVAQLLHRGVG